MMVTIMNYRARLHTRRCSVRLAIRWELGLLIHTLLWYSSEFNHFSSNQQITIFWFSLKKKKKTCKFPEEVCKVTNYRNEPIDFLCMTCFFFFGCLLLLLKVGEIIDLIFLNIKLSISSVFWRNQT